MGLSDRLVADTRDAWRGVRSEIEAHVRRLWAEPELPLMEVRAADALSAWLERHGFERGARRVRHPDRVRGALRPGSGARHRAPGGVRRAAGAGQSRGAAPGARRARRGATPAATTSSVRRRWARPSPPARRWSVSGCPGTLVVLGCPAEELLWGKVALLERGGFAGIDALLTSHADYQNGALSRPCLACVSSELVFTGVASHGGAVRRHNALEALELATQAIDRLRGSRFHGLVIGHVVRAGGLMPSITPEEARVWLTVRHESFETARDAYRRDRRHRAGTRRGWPGSASASSWSRRAAATSRTTVWRGSSTRTCGWSARRRGAPEDLAWHGGPLPSLRSGGPLRASPRSSRLHTEGCDPYGQDDGEASWRIPLGRVNWAIPRAVPLHHWGATALSGHAAGPAGPAHGLRGAGADGGGAARRSRARRRRPAASWGSVSGTARSRRLAAATSR